jgi:PAS domain S-box
MADLIVDEIGEEDIKRYYGDKWHKSPLIEGAYEAEDFFPDKGETGKWLFFTAAPIKGSKEDIIGSIETLWDITQSKLMQREREKLIRRLSTLWSISNALSTSLDIEKSLQPAVNEIIDNLDVDSVGVYLKEKNSVFRVAYSYGYSESFYQKGSETGADGVIGKTAQTGKTIIFEDVTGATAPYKEFVLDEGLKSAAYLPLILKEGAFGVIRMSSHTSRRFSKEDKGLLELIANRIAIAVENIRLHHQTKIFSRHLELMVKEKTKELEESYRKLAISEERYRTTFDADPNPIFLMSRRSLRLLDVNATAVDCYGHARDEFLKMSFWDLGCRNDPEMIEGLKDISLNQLNFYPKRIHRRKGGDPFYVNIHIRLGRYLKRDILIATTTDVTESVEKEIQLVQADKKAALAQAGKMATLGTMAAGIAHEINQPLNVIQVCADYFLKMVKRGEEIGRMELTTMADEIRSNVQRAAEITNHMRDFARQSEVVKSKLDINDPIRDTLKILGRQLNVRRIEPDLDLDDTLPQVMADRNRLEQVFLNLATNAMDALDDKDKMMNQEWKKVLEIKSFSEGGQVIVTVCDNGPGIPPEIIDKIFDPFFTTKEVGKGIGLGMSISYGIVRDFGGAIEVKSEVGKGTTFTLRFPSAV